MKRASIAVAVLVALALTGCAGTPEDAPGDPEQAATSTTAPTEEASAPLVAETPAELDAEDAEAAFVAEVRQKLRPNNVIPNATDEQIIEAGYAACEAVSVGTPTDQISVIEGEEADHGYYTDSLVLVSATATTLCPR